jgi:hypothetical protein
VPHLNGPATAGAAGLKQNVRLGIAACKDIMRMVFRRDPYYVDIVAAPGELGAMTAPNALEGVLKLIPAGFAYDKHVAARIFLSIIRYSPGNLSHTIQCPWLVQVALRDRTTPVKPAIKAVQRAPKGEIIKYDVDHFDVYVSPHFERVVSDQLDFLKRHVAL